VGFADLVGFTALSNQLDQDRLGELVEIFETRAGDLVAARGGRIIKTLGDSVLFVAEDSASAMEIAEGVIGVIGGDSRLPDVRIGLATGSVVTRMGDVFGPPVNMAARLTVLARRNRVVTDQATADLLPADRYELRRLTKRPVRGFGMVEPVAVRRH
jgi:adenylate cyclase